ncbi:hypothetical protein PHMEG_0005073 [Phytophthora megakarya]|uniref:Uncharacterized protein n=1 Tax=Phytophthora megakarya TaxID=4795 RepID=A0A225WS81_9STRA|nr:hypothetical protein PHMEG_0005073 [Phytophthora megakarya]
MFCRAKDNVLDTLDIEWAKSFTLIPSLLTLFQKQILELGWHCAHVASAYHAK